MEPAADTVDAAFARMREEFLAARQELTHLPGRVLLQRQQMSLGPQKGVGCEEAAVAPQQNVELLLRCTKALEATAVQHGMETLRTRDALARAEESHRSATDRALKLVEGEAVELRTTHTAQRIEGLQSELGTLRGALDTSTHEYEQLLERTQALEVAAAQHRAESMSTREALARAEEARSSASARACELQREATQLRAAYDTQWQELSDLRQALGASSQKHEQLQVENARLEAELQESRGKGEAGLLKLARLEPQLAGATRSQAQLERRAQLAEHELSVAQAALETEQRASEEELSRLRRLAAKAEQYLEGMAAEARVVIEHKLAAAKSQGALKAEQRARVKAETERDAALAGVPLLPDTYLATLSLPPSARHHTMV